MSNLEIFFELVKISLLSMIAISVSNDPEISMLTGFFTLVILLLSWWGISYVF